MGKRKEIPQRRTGAVDGDETRRTWGTRIAAPLIVASLIAIGEISFPRPPAASDAKPRATSEPVIDTPAFVRPPKPSPDVLVSPRIRIG